MNGYGFTSALAPQLDAYLRFKQKMGCYGNSRIWYLKRFDAYCTAHERAVFDRDTVEGWVSEQVARSGRYRSWMSYIRDVGRWLQAHGHAGAYVLSDRWKAQVVPAHPYLLSRLEIEAFFAAAASLEVINYIEHYGLMRAEVAPGRYERVSHLHSWNASQRLSNWLLFNLQRHSDHHERASRPYPALLHHDDSPQLPAGYATMYVLALVPPLWHRVMDDRVARAQAGAVRAPTR